MEDGYVLSGSWKNSKQNETTDNQGTVFNYINFRSFHSTLGLKIILIQYTQCEKIFEPQDIKIFSCYTSKNDREILPDGFDNN